MSLSDGTLDIALINYIDWLEDVIQRFLNEGHSLATACFLKFVYMDLMARSTQSQHVSIGLEKLLNLQSLKLFLDIFLGYIKGITLKHMMYFHYRVVDRTVIY